MVTNNQWRIPVPFVGIFILSWTGFDANSFTTKPVVTAYISILRFTVDNIGIGGI